ncbi:MAG: sugar phosphate isomerase/epimerase [Phycisphaeraceae bacterium]|nr:sugar phosphate isomerase/epimerase [Phycisphaeraceae bacterium]
MAITDMPLGVTAVMLPELDLDEQLALCAKLGVTHYCARPRVVPEAQVGQPWSNWGNHKFDLTPKRLAAEATAIRGKILHAGLVPFGTVPALYLTDADDELMLNIKGCADLGAGRIRVAMPLYPSEPFDYDAELRKQVDGYRRVVGLAKPLGVKIVIETHCGTIACSPALAMNICRHFDPSELGVIMDIANYTIEGGIAPHLAVSVLGPYIDHVHIGGARSTFGEYDALGFRRPAYVMAPITEVNTHIPSWIKALAQSGRKVPLVIEDYTANKPGPLRLSDTAIALRRVLEAL